MRSILIALAVLCFAGAAFAAMPFADVPQNHWAYEAIQKAVDAGILQGFDGQFHGKKLLNRYQMAVIVAKILDVCKSPAGKALVRDGKGVENIEALTIEFADELALLNVKVSTLEDSFVELKNDVEKIKGGRVAVGGEAPAGGMGFSCFASFGLVMADDYMQGPAAATGGDVFTPWQSAADTNFFTDPIIGLGAQKDLGGGIGFNLRLAANTHVNNGSVVEVEHAYFHMDELLGKNVAGNVGGFTLEKLSLEHNGAFGTCDMTITPSYLNYAWRTTHVYGMDFMNKPEKAEDVQFSLALMSATDFAPGSFGAPGAGYYFSNLTTDDWWRLPGGVEGDDGFGYLLFVKKPIATSKLGWNFAYYSNGGDIAPGGTAAPSPEIDIMQLGIDWAATKDLAVLLQYASADITYAPAPTPEGDATLWFLMLNYKMDAKQSLTLRYETDDANSGAPAALDAELKTITFAWNRKCTDNSMFQFEYLSPDFDTGVVGYQDVNDDMIQFRYKVWF